MIVFARFALTVLITNTLCESVLKVPIQSVLLVAPVPTVHMLVRNAVLALYTNLAPIHSVAYVVSAAQWSTLLDSVHWDWILSVVRASRVLFQRTQRKRYVAQAVSMRHGFRTTAVTAQTVSR